MNDKIILASGSPRRRELLAQIGMDFIVCKSDCEEKIRSTVPEEIVCTLSADKAADVYRGIRQGHLSVPDAYRDGIVLGADTVVAYEGQILGKPASCEEAVRMLTMLSGRTHTVYTGVTLYGQRNGVLKTHSFCESTQVQCYPLSEQEIRSYVESGEPMDKAGAYGIQGRFAAFIREIRGDYNNVVGLPVGRLYQELKRWREA